MLSDQCYSAMSRAADRMGAGNYAAQLRVHLRHGRVIGTFRFCVTAEHAEVVRLMGDRAALDGPAMAYLHEYDVLAQRLSGAQSFARGVER